MAEGAQTHPDPLAELIAGLRPRGELAPYCEYTGSAGLFPQFAAVAAGLRPGMDCWVPFRRLDDFAAFARSRGLAVSTDCAFRPLPAQEREQVVGIETLCTTHALGVRVENARDGDSVHVFVAGTDAAADHMRSCGWYPVVVEGRLFHKPTIDHTEFGRLLGYPACCIRFFEASNNWNRTNTYAESFFNTKGRYDYRANCFGKNLGYSFNFHMPCSFHCVETIRFCAALESYLSSSEPDYVAACRQLLRLPVLSLNEREIMVLHGTIDRSGRARYDGVRDLFSTSDSVLKVVRSGNLIEIRGHFAVVFRDSEFIDAIECRCDEFGPRVPLLIGWT